jgi:anti-sigma factor RsiW
MRGSKERVNAETKRLQCYLDGEMSNDEAEAFRTRLAENPALCRQLHEMQRVGTLVRDWSALAEARAKGLVEPTLARVQNAERKRVRQTTLGYAVATALLLLLPWSRQAPALAVPAVHTQPVEPSVAAIERIEAGDKQAQVFVLGGSNTPVVWLADDAPDDDAPEPQDPG